ncbi:MAG: hypothetical protein L0Y72_21395 [Gemmataceae bacterium]|nr:hypothetical protein [Gemmataceae bacterium]
MREKHDSPNYSFALDKGGGRCKRTYYLPWSKDNDPEITVFLAGLDFLGYSTLQFYGPGKQYLSRKLAHEHPVNQKMLATTISEIRPTFGVGKDSHGIGMGDEAEIDVLYEWPRYQVRTDEEVFQLAGINNPGQPGPAQIAAGLEQFLLKYFRFKLETGGYWQNLPALAPFFWTGPPFVNGDLRAPVAMESRVLIPQGNVYLEWMQVPFQVVQKLIETNFNNLIGKTNSAAIGHPQSIAGIFAAKTLVCGMPKIEYYPLPDGFLAADITYHFTYYPHGANAHYRWDAIATAGPNAGQSVPGYQGVARPGTVNQGPYEADAFAGLFDYL